MANLSQDAALLAQKKQASNTRMLLNTNGETTLLEVDKHAIIHRAGRDLRILDPLLCYLSTILERERAIVLNLEVLLLDPMNKFVIPVVEELRRRLPGGESDNLGQEGSESEGKDLDGNVDGTALSPLKSEQGDNMPESDRMLSV